MKQALSLCSLFIALLIQQPNDITGVWLATDVPYAPWVFELKQSGATLTGSTWQNGAVRTVAQVEEGVVNGNEISFKVKGGGTGGTITFKGTRSGETISFTRTASTSGSVGDGLYGAAAANHVTVTRMPPGSTPPARPSAAAATSSVSAPAAASTPTVAPAGTQHWEATGVGFAPWTFDLKIDGGIVTGVIGQARLDPPTSTTTTLVGPFEIYDGKAAGDNIEFKAKTADSLRIITFQGVRNGDSISFKRSVQVISGNRGQNGILGGDGATEFVAILGRSAAPAVTANPAPAVAPTGPSGRWQTTGIPSAPWTFEFTAAATSLTGTVQQTPAPSSAVSIAAGKINGTTISFKVLSPDGERVITFTGRVNVNEISFVRDITILPGGSRGGVDLYGSGAPLQFVATRANTTP